MHINNKHTKLPRFAYIEYQGMKFSVPAAKETQGLSLAFDPDYFPNYIELASHILNPISEDSKPVVIDIGASIGHFSIFCAKILSEKKGVVYAYEAKHLYYMLLASNIFMNQMDNIFCRKSIPFNQQGMTTYPNYDYISLTNNQHISLDMSYNLKYEIDCPLQDNSTVSASAVMLDHEPIEGNVALINIFSPGIEHKIIEGGIKLLAQHHFPPIICFDNHKTRKSIQTQKLHQHLKSLNYDIKYFSEDFFLAQHQSKIIINFA